MKFSVLISTRRTSGLLAHLTNDLFTRGLFPEEFSASVLGIDSVRVRLELDCNHNAIRALQDYWSNQLKIEMIVVDPSPTLAEAIGPDERIDVHMD